MELSNDVRGRLIEVCFYCSLFWLFGGRRALAPPPLTFSNNLFRAHSD